MQGYVTEGQGYDPPTRVVPLALPIVPLACIVGQDDTEGEVDMDDTRRSVLMAELDDAKGELQRLAAFVEMLSLRLGIPLDTASPASSGGSGDTPEEAPAVPGHLSDDPLELVYPNEFVGMSLSKAAEEVLKRFSPPPQRRPLKTPVLTDAIRKGGLEVKSPSNLYRSLHKHSRFHSLKSGLWGLAEWYPDAVRQQTKVPAPTPPPEVFRQEGHPDTSFANAEDDTTPTEEVAS